MSHASKFIQLISIAIHADRKRTDGLLKKMGLKLSDFQHEEKVLDNHKTEGKTSSDDELLGKDKPLKKVFTSTEVDVLLDEIRQRKAKRQGLEQVRLNRGDTGDQLFGKDGLKNVIAPKLVSKLLKAGFSLIEVQRERKPARYTPGDVNQASEVLEGEGEISENCCVTPVPTGENGEVTEEDVKKAEEAQLMYFSSIEEGLLKKTHPTVAKPTGTVQVWKYVVRATFLHSDEDGGAVEIAKALEDKVLACSIWSNCHIWENPDGSATVNLTPMEDGRPKVLTALNFDPKGEDFTTRVYPNTGHPKYSPDFDRLAERERQRIERVRREGARLSSWRHEARQQAWRPAPGNRFGDILKGKLEGKENGNNTPLPPAS